MIFTDRAAAGQQLANVLNTYKNKPDVVVLGLPRGGVVTAAAVAGALHAPLDIVITRKLGAPGNKEYAVGALTEQGTVVGGGTATIIAQEKTELARRVQQYRQGKLPLDVKNKTVILVDDGIATGLTMQAAIASIRQQQPKRLIVAVPVAPPDTVIKLRTQVDELIVLDQPDNFMAVGQFYEKFDQVTDEEVQYYLQRYAQN